MFSLYRNRDLVDAAWAPSGVQRRERARCRFECAVYRAARATDKEMCRRWLAAIGTQSNVELGQPTLHVTAMGTIAKTAQGKQRKTIAPKKQPPELTASGSRVQSPNMKMEA